MAIKPLIIGQAPANGNDGLPPFSGRSGWRLKEILGLGHDGRLDDYFDLVNLMDFYPGKQGKGDAFDMRIARKNALLLMEDLTKQPRRRILFMGRKVRRAMGAGEWPYLQWRSYMQHEAAIFPHPSGVNRWWNDPAHQEAAADFLTELVWEVEHGSAT